MIAVLENCWKERYINRKSQAKSDNDKIEIMHGDEKRTEKTLEGKFKRFISLTGSKIT